MTHWKTMMDRRFLAELDLRGKNVILTISKVEQGQVRDKKGAMINVPVLCFKETQKKFVVKTTNGTAIETLYGPDYEGWIGKRVEMVSAMTKMGGVPVKCIRIAPRVPTGKQDPAQVAQLEEEDKTNAQS